MTYKTYLFDMDGTLLDTLDDLTAAVNHTLEQYGAASGGGHAGVCRHYAGL